MDKGGILLKQYELLRQEIVQCIYLRQVAIVGIYTSILTGVSIVVSKGGGTSLAKSGSLPFVILGFTFLVNSFGSLYLHEQHRNRRACLFNRVIERLLTKAASTEAIGEEREPEEPEEDEEAPNPGRRTCYFIGWENFLVSKACRTTNLRFYFARYLGVALPILVFSVPAFVVAFLVSSAYNEITKGMVFLLVCLTGLGVTLLLLVAGARAWRKALEQRGNCKCLSRVVDLLLKLLNRWVVGLLYTSPCALVGYALYPIHGNLTFPEGFVLSSSERVGVLLWSALAVSFLMALWSLYIFFHVAKWLGGETPANEENEVGKWVSAFCREASTADAHSLLTHWDL